MKLPLHREMTNDEIGEVFEFVAQVVGRRASNRYRARAYEEAGVVIHQQRNELYEKFEKDGADKSEEAKKEFLKYLDSLPGIGESISAKLLELFTTGDIKSFQKYVSDLPGGIYPLVKLYGIGVKRAEKLADEFDLNNPATAIDELLVKAKEGKVRDVEGFGEKSEKELIKVLEERYKKSRIPREKALEVAEKVRAVLEKTGQVEKVEFLGSLRREAETVGDIDMGAVVSDVSKLRNKLNEMEIVKKVLVAGDNMIRIIVDNDWQVDLKLSSADEWGSFVQHFTGSKEHNIRLREYAIKRGLSLSEHGIKDRESGKVKKFADEKEFYKYLGLKWIPPKERVGKGEIEKYLEE